jgi:tetratricopeptide (TPR) repeat protein
MRSPICLPHDFDAARQIGVTLFKLQRYHEALTASDHALAIDQKNIWNWISKGETLTALQRYDEALLT